MMLLELGTLLGVVYISYKVNKIDNNTDLPIKISNSNLTGLHDTSHDESLKANRHGHYSGSDHSSDSVAGSGVGSGSWVNARND